MARTTSSDVFIPDLLVDAIKQGLAGMKVFAGTDIAIVDTTSKVGKAEVGQPVKVPYFTNIGEAEEITTDGAALAVETLASSAEQALVRHFGKAVELTRLAQSGAGDPYTVGAGMVIEAIRRVSEKILLDAAKSSTNMSSMTLDYSGGGGHTLTLDDIIRGRMLFGDEQDGIEAIAVHSEKLKDLYLLKDTGGRPILVDQPNGALPLLQPFGIKVICSDRLAPVSSVYTSLIFKRRALALWLNGTPTVDTDRDILRDSDVLAAHVYGCVHRYLHVDAGTKPGVAILKNN